MIFIAVFALGFALGYFRAKRRGGGQADRLRYGLAHGLAFALPLLAIVAFLDFTGWAW